ncbi:MAG: UDP-N-acetylmuramoyl-L-alanyl-D-glutamate--2,6-diaminopimelate ligase [Oceanipulchritudo sp.]
MTWKLEQLLEGLAGLSIRGNGQATIQSLATDSRRVGPGSLFFAVPGLRTDGHYFIAEAVDRGAVAVVSEKDCWVPPHVTLVLVRDLRKAVAAIASRFFAHPAGALQLTGFLGTSGKTVASMVLRHFLQGEDPVGLLGTIHYMVGNRTLPAHRTTPEPIELHTLLAQMRDKECRRVLMEVSSHGIDQGRVAGLAFRNLVLLNLTPEHLQYHGSFERYVRLETDFLAMQMDKLENFIVGMDDPKAAEVSALLPAPPQSGNILRFGTGQGTDFRAEEIRYSERDTRFALCWPEGRVKLVSPLLGEFNLQNVLAAMACGYAEGLDPAEMGASLLSFTGVRGRMERLDVSLPFNVIIDYMHTEAAYEKGLDMLRGLTGGRLVTIFGCGGNRDPSTRPVITSIVASMSDEAIATADNPRNETVEAIFGDMRKGNEGFANLSFVEDRRSAIARAIGSARPGDTVLIAGKGHETFQEFGDCVVPFDDRAVAREIIQNKQWQER